MAPRLPKLNNLPASLPIEGAVRIELAEGIPIFRASGVVQGRSPTDWDAVASGICSCEYNSRAPLVL